MAFPVYIKSTNKKRISIQKEIREVNRLRLRFERGMARKLSSLFAKAGRQAAQAYSSGGNVTLATRDLEKELTAVFAAQYGSVIDTFAGRVTGDRKDAYTFQFLVDRFLRRHGAKAVTGVAVTTQYLIRFAIQAGEKEGLGVDKTAKLITEKTSGAIGRSRAVTIARTETHAAASYATDEATKQLNLPNQKKRWVSVGDGRTRPSHAAANGQEVLIDEAFLIRDKGTVIAMKYPHDGNGGASNNINCRCLAVYYTEEDELFDDLDLEEGIEKPQQSIVKPPTKRPVKEPIKIADLVNTGAARGALFEERLNDWLSPLTASVAAKYPRPRTITDSKRGFMSYDGELSSDLNRSTLAHEYGHHIDNQIGTAEGITRPWGANHWSNDGLKASWAKDRSELKIFRVSRENRDKKLNEIYDLLFTKEVTETDRYIRTKSLLKFDGADALSDMVDSMVGGVFRKNYAAYGHQMSYWKGDRTKAMKECFANLYAIHDKPKAMEVARMLFPNMVKDFEEKLRQVDKVGKVG